MNLENYEDFPLITVGITSYNSVYTIDRAINSALSQDWCNLEVIVVDDCSTDDTVSHISDLYKNIDNVTIICNSTNKGVAYTRNKIINNAKGDYLVFFDDDDESANDRVTRQFHSLKEIESLYGSSVLAISHVGRNIIYEKSKYIYQSPICVGSLCFGELVAKHFLVGFGLKNSGSISTCAQMANLSTYKNLGGFDITFRRVEDSDFIIRAAFRNTIFTGVNLPLVNQYMIKKDKSLENEYIYHKKLIEKHRDYLIQEGFYNFVISWFETKYSFFKNDSYLFKLFILLISHPILSYKRFFDKKINLHVNRYFFNWHNNIN